MRDNETTATTLVGEIRLKGELAGKEEPLHSWVPRSNHELDGQQQQQVNLVPKAFYSNFVCDQRSNRDALINIIVDEIQYAIKELNKCGCLYTICTGVYC